MEANEMRLGNYFQTNIIQQVTIEHLEFLLNPELDHSVMKPIELTEDWLLKMGFDSLVSGTYICPNQIVLRKEINGYSYEIFKGKETTIQHVHQLQNLYYALTNTELTINL